MKREKPCRANGASQGQEGEWQHCRGALSSEEGGLGDRDGGRSGSWQQGPDQAAGTSRAVFVVCSKGRRKPLSDSKRSRVSEITRTAGWEDMMGTRELVA